jgi:hypothetical protein
MHNLGFQEMDDHHVITFAVMVSKNLAQLPEVHFSAR